MTKFRKPDVSGKRLSDQSIPRYDEFIITLLRAAIPIFCLFASKTDPAFAPKIDPPG
jgi:hypothetical protein